MPVRRKDSAPTCRAAEGIRLLRGGPSVAEDCADSHGMVFGGGGMEAGVRESWDRLEELLATMG